MVRKKYDDRQKRNSTLHLFSRLSVEVKNKHHDTLSRRNGINKGKGNLVEARPAAAMPSAKNQTGED